MNKLKTTLKFIYMGISVQVTFIILSAAFTSLHFKELNTLTKQSSSEGSIFLYYCYLFFRNTFVDNSIVLSYFLFIAISLAGLIICIYKRYKGNEAFNSMIIKYSLALLMSSSLYLIVLNFCVIFLF